MSVCGGDALDRVVVVPGPPGKDGKDGVVDPSVLTELAEPGDDTGVVVVDSGEVKFSRWSAFKARIAQWLSSGPEAVSANTQTDLSDVPEVRGVRLSPLSSPNARELRVLDHRAGNPGGVPYDGAVWNIGYDAAGANEADTLARLRARKGGLFIASEHVDGVSPSHIVLAPRLGNVYVGNFGAVSAAAVPGNQVVTASNVVSLSNKTLVSPTITGSVSIQNPTFVNSTGFQPFTIDSQAASVNSAYVSASVSGSDVLFGVGNAADENVNLRLVTKGDGLVFARIGDRNPSGAITSGPVAVVVGTPATPTTAGQRGQIAYDSNYFYACLADNSWKRVAWDAW